MGTKLRGVLKMVQHRTILEEEEYIVDKKRVEALNNHIRLPTACTVKSQGGIAWKTYLWNTPTTQCPDQHRKFYRRTVMAIGA